MAKRLTVTLYRSPGGQLQWRITNQGPETLSAQDAVETLRAAATAVENGEWTQLPTGAGLKLNAEPEH